MCASAFDADAQTQPGVAWVGDSRAYLLHDQHLGQLTEDHTLTADLIRRGEITAAQARDHPWRGILTRTLGLSPDMEADSAVSAVTIGDRILICTDGLFSELDEGEIAAILTTERDLAGAARQLVRRAVDGGGN